MAAYGLSRIVWFALSLGRFRAGIRAADEGGTMAPEARFAYLMHSFNLLEGSAPSASRATQLAELMQVSSAYVLLWHSYMAAMAASVNDEYWLARWIETTPDGSEHVTREAFLWLDNEPRLPVPSAADADDTAPAPQAAADMLCTSFVDQMHAEGDDERQVVRDVQKVVPGVNVRVVLDLANGHARDEHDRLLAEAGVEAGVLLPPEDLAMDDSVRVQEVLVPELRLAVVELCASLHAAVVRRASFDPAAMDGVRAAALGLCRREPWLLVHTARAERLVTLFGRLREEKVGAGAPAEALTPDAAWGLLASVNPDAMLSAEDALGPDVLTGRLRALWRALCATGAEKPRRRGSRLDRYSDEENALCTACAWSWRDIVAPEADVTALTEDLLAVVARRGAGLGGEDPGLEKVVSRLGSCMAAVVCVLDGPKKGVRALALGLDPCADEPSPTGWDLASRLLSAAPGVIHRAEVLNPAPDGGGNGPMDAATRAQLLAAAIGEMCTTLDEVLPDIGGSKALVQHPRLLLPPAAIREHVATVQELFPKTPASKVSGLIAAVPWALSDPPRLAARLQELQAGLPRGVNARRLVLHSPRVLNLRNVSAKISALSAAIPESTPAQLAALSPSLLTCSIEESVEPKAALLRSLLPAEQWEALAQSKRLGRLLLSSKERILRISVVFAAQPQRVVGAKPSVDTVLTMSDARFRGWCAKLGPAERRRAEEAMAAHGMNAR